MLSTGHNSKHWCRPVWLAASTVILLLLFVNDTQAQSIIASQTMEASWSWFDQNFDQRFDSDTVSYSGLGNRDKTFSVVGAPNSKGTVWANVDSNGRIFTQAVAISDTPNATNGFYSLEMESTNSITINDLVHSTHPSAAYVLFSPHLDGLMVQRGRTVGSGVTNVGEMEFFNQIDVVAQGGTGSSIFESEPFLEQNLMNPDIDRQFPINSNSIMRFDLTPGIPIDFILKYDEIAKFNIENVDAFGFYMQSSNFFMNTFEIFANVYDQDGNLLEGETVTSALGHTYQNFSVPEPSSAMLVALASTVLMVRRRRVC